MTEQDREGEVEKKRRQRKKRQVSPPKNRKSKNQRRVVQVQALCRVAVNLVKEKMRLRTKADREGAKPSRDLLLSRDASFDEQVTQGG